MLKKRTRSVHQDQAKAYPHMSASDFLLTNDFRNQRARKNSVFNVPRLFVGLSFRGLFECDAARSPTSTLDHRVLSSAGGRFKDQKCWDCSKVGLSIIDDHGMKVESRTKNIIFAPQLRIKSSTSGSNFDACKASKSLPKNYQVFSRSKIKGSHSKASSSRCIFEIGDETHDPTEPELVEVFQSCSLDSFGRRLLHMPNNFRKSNLGSSLIDQKFCSRKVANSHIHPPPAEVPPKAGNVSQLCSESASADIELSEDYTCVITHGPNPKTTHIYSDCILGSHSKYPNANAVGLTTNIEQRDTLIHPATKCTDISALFPSEDFLSACYNCGKKLDGGDIFMYKGEKAFCGIECRESEIINNEDSDETGSNLSESDSSSKNDGRALSNLEKDQGAVNT